MLFSYCSQEMYAGWLSRINTAQSSGSRSDAAAAAPARLDTPRIGRRAGPRCRHPHKPGYAPTAAGSRGAACAIAIVRVPARPRGETAIGSHVAAGSARGR